MFPSQATHPTIGSQFWLKTNFQKKKKGNLLWYVFLSDQISRLSLFQFTGQESVHFQKGYS